MPARMPLQPGDFKALDRDPETAAASIYDYAPRTLDALITLYCQAYADDAPPGRHIETADITGEAL